MSDSATRPIDAHRLRLLIQLALAEHPEVAAVRPVQTIYSDRLALAVEDRDGALWRLHVLADPLRRGTSKVP